MRTRLAAATGCASTISTARARSAASGASAGGRRRAQQRPDRGEPGEEARAEERAQAARRLGRDLEAEPALGAELEVAEDEAQDYVAR